MGMSLDVEIRKKPTKHFSTCNSCSKEIEVGTWEFSIIADGYRASKCINYHIPCFFRWFSDNLPKLYQKKGKNKFVKGMIAGMELMVNNLKNHD